MREQRQTYDSASKLSATSPFPDDESPLVAVVDRQ